jgi:xanthine dehydrogenase small subunit
LNRFFSASLLPEAVFNFEKVSKRTHLDIASVNCACLLHMNEEGIVEAMHLSAGGVAPFPKYLDRTVTFLVNKKVSAEVLKEAISTMNGEVAPISDARGTADYKRLLLRQLFLAHFANDGETGEQNIINHCIDFTE